MALESTEEQKRLKPDVLQTALLDEIAERLLSIETKIANSQPKGIVEPLPTVTVTTTPLVITPPQKKPWFSVTIVNDGPSTCYAIVNTEKSSTQPSEIRVNEVVEMDMGTGRITDIYVHTESGTASLRIRGIR